MSLRSLLPFDNYILVTELSETEVIKRISDNVEPRNNISMMGMRPSNGTRKPYAGMVKGHNFEISRVIDYKNSFLPVIKGEVASFLGKTEVKIKMSPHIGVLLFCAFWMFMVLVGCIGVSFVMIHDGFEPMLLIPFGMAVFGSLLFTVPYKIEAKKSRHFLAELLEEDDIPIVL